MGCGGVVGCGGVMGCGGVIGCGGVMGGGVGRFCWLWLCGWGWLARGWRRRRLRGQRGQIPTAPFRWVPTDWVLKPSNVKNGEDFRLLFMPSSRVLGNRTNDISNPSVVRHELTIRTHVAIRPYLKYFNAVAALNVPKNSSDGNSHPFTRTTQDALNNAISRVGWNTDTAPLYWLGANSKVASSKDNFFSAKWSDYNLRDANGSTWDASGGYTIWTGLDLGNTNNRGAAAARWRTSLGFPLARGPTPLTSHAGIQFPAAWVVNAARSGISVSLDNWQNFHHLLGMSPRFKAIIPEASVAVNTASAAEGHSGSKIRILTVSIAPTPAAVLPIKVCLGGTASHGEDYTVQGATPDNQNCFTTSLGGAQGSSRSYNIHVQGDTKDERDEEAVFVLSAGDGYQISDTRGKAVTTIEDDDREESSIHRLSLRMAQSSVVEGDSGGKNINLFVELSGGTRSDLTGSDVCVSGTAGASGDAGSSDWGFYTESGRILRQFNADGCISVHVGKNSTRAQQVIRVYGDTVEESDETIQFELRLKENPPVDVELAATGTTATFTIANDDPKVTITGGDSITEGEPAVFTVSASPTPGANLSVNLRVAEETTSQQDFVAAGDEGMKTVTIPASGDSAGSASFTVNTQADAVYVPDGRVTVQVEPGGTNYGVGNPGSANYVIREKDIGVTVSAPAGDLYENSTGGTKSVTLTLSEAPGAGKTATVTLDWGGGATLGTDFATRVPASAPAGVEYRGDATRLTEVRFTGGTGASTTATFEVAAIVDRVFDEGDETVTLAASAAESGIAPAVDSGVSFRIINDLTTPAPAAVFTQAVSTIHEDAESGARSYTATVRLSEAAAADVLVNYEVSGTANAMDYETLSGSVTILKGQSAGAVTITAVDDGMDEARESLILTLAHGTDYKPGARDTRHTVTLVDGDHTGVNIQNKGSFTPKEGEHTVFELDIGRALVAGEALVVKLSAAGSATLGADYRLTGEALGGVTYSGLDNGDVTVIFTGGAGASRYARIQALTLVDDEVEGAGDQRESMYFVSRSADWLSPVNLDGGVNKAQYNGSFTGGYFLIRDGDPDDRPLIQFTTTGSRLTEGQAGMVAARLDGSTLAADGTALVEVLGSIADVRVRNPVGLGLHVVGLSAGGQTALNVEMTESHDDDLDEPPERVHFLLHPGAGYRLGPRNRHTVTIIDNDPTAVTLTAGADKALTEGNPGDTAVVTLALGRSLAVGEVAEIPLLLSSATGAALPGVYAPAFSLQAGGGVTLTGADTPTPTVRFEGGAQTATLTFAATANVDEDETDETVTVAFGELAAAGLATNLDGGLLATTAAERVTLTITDAPLVLARFAQTTSQVAEESGQGHGDCAAVRSRHHGCTGELRGVGYGDRRG